MSDDTHLSRRRALRSAAALAGGLGAAGLTGVAMASPAGALTTDAVYDKGGAVFNVRGYGATGNGSTDDAASIRSAVAAAAAAGGGIVFLPAGTYLVGSTIAVTTSGVNVVGAGQGAARIRTSGFVDGDVLAFSNVDRCSVRNLTISAATTRTSGAAIHLSASSRIYIQDVDLDSQFHGVLIDGGGVLQYIDRGYWTRFAGGGVGLYVNASNSNDTYISNVTMDQNGNGATPLAGVRVQGSQALWASNLDILAMRDGLLIDPPNAGQVCFFFLDRCAFDNNVDRGIRIQPAAGSLCRGLTFVDCWTSSSHTYDGMYVGPNTDGVELIGHRAFGNKGNGVLVDGATNVFVDASGAAGNQGAGFVFQGNTNKFALRNSRSGNYASIGASQTYGAVVTAGCNNYILSNNIFQDNATAAYSELGGPTKSVTGNI